MPRRSSAAANIVGRFAGAAALERLSRRPSQQLSLIARRWQVQPAPVPLPTRRLQVQTGGRGSLPPQLRTAALRRAAGAAALVWHAALALSAVRRGTHAHNRARTWRVRSFVRAAQKCRCEGRKNAARGNAGDVRQQPARVAATRRAARTLAPPQAPPPGALAPCGLRSPFPMVVPGPPFRGNGPSVPALRSSPRWDPVQDRP